MSRIKRKHKIRGLRWGNRLKKQLCYYKTRQETFKKN